LKEVNNKETSSTKKPTRSKIENKFTETTAVQVKETPQADKPEKVLTRAQRAKLNIN